MDWIKCCKLIIGFLMGLFFFSACVSPGYQISTGGNETAVMNTVQAVWTKVSVDTLVAQVTELSAGLSATQQPVEVFTATQTAAGDQAQASATPTPTLVTDIMTVTPSSTVAPLISATPTVTPTGNASGAGMEQSSATAFMVLPTATYTPYQQTAGPTKTFTASPFLSPTSTMTQSAPVFVLPTATYTPFQSQQAPTQTASSTPVTPTATQASGTYCNWASFVQDISVPDGSKFEGGMTFTKVWRLKNIGTCTWNTGYALVFDSGNSLDGPASIPLPRSVAPGETIDLAVSLRAPGLPAVYMSYWKLQSDTGEKFGIGSKANGVFWVKMETVFSVHYAFPFYDQACNATWTTQNGAVPCDGKMYTTTGSVTYVTEPIWEGGSARKDQATLITIPASGTGGFIQGVFPPYHVKAGDHLNIRLGCLDDHPNCEVNFTLMLKDAYGTVTTLFGPHYQIDDGFVYALEMDLTPYVDKTVQFIFRTDNHNGSSVDDYAMWFFPIVWND